ncbi:MAG: response regulator [Bacteroidetes bacterium]|jgi:DNA-binding response OmpR family regulator|nr:response regulator [Bacteroidota bacterium]
MQLIVLKITGLLIMPEPLLQPILIVDSDEQSVDNISSGLKANGYLVITAPDGYDGYVRAKRESPKVIIANDLLPYVSGFKLSKLIKCDDRHQDTKIIIMSNSTGPAIDKMFKQSSADKMLEKPFQLKDIMQLLEIKEDSN